MPLFKNLSNNVVSSGKRMFNWNGLREGYQEIYRIGRAVYKPEATTLTPENRKINLPPEKIKSARFGMKRLLFLFTLFFVFAIVYALVSFIKGHIVLGLLALCFSVLCASFMFRYHFWLYQIKRGELGCRISEWYRDEIQLKSKTKPATQRRAK